ncbi:hypothetical protein CPS_0115 [Colwellia psychrerythraea 34H]|uniref:Uncharacterized protein n=1 Tax=Colwellia psychrerythraea (strain 34H / ATCC BAA-681) TaxID=167879 RepID=Q48AN0_COLP3|nr:hypothetical protein CPS_0115 [Colwellia psychrerythraea 34H]
MVDNVIYWMGIDFILSNINAHTLTKVYKKQHCRFYYHP